jgi:hypothetical protein
VSVGRRACNSRCPKARTRVSVAYLLQQQCSSERTPTALSSARNAPPAHPPSPLLCRQAPVKSPTAAPPHLPPPTWPPGVGRISLTNPPRHPPPLPSCLVLSCADLTSNSLTVPSQLPNLFSNTQHLEPERSRENTVRRPSFYATR